MVPPFDIRGNRVDIPDIPEGFHASARGRYQCIGTVDEVVTGFRYSLGGAQKLYGVSPDISCFAKAISNGIPLSAVVGRKKYMKLFIFNIIV